MTESTPSILEAARKTLPGGTLGILTLPKGFKFVASKGSGASIWNTDGRKFVDYLMGSGSIILGHANRAIIDAVTAQLQNGTNFYVENETAINLGKEVISAVPCGEKVRFVSSGSEANVYAMRLARAFTGKDLIMKFEGAYHGFTDYAMLSSQFADPKKVSTADGVTVDSAGIPAAVAKTMIASPFNDVAAARRMIESHAKDLAAVIIEPMQRTIAPKPGFLQELRELTASKGIPLIFDEIVTGFRFAYGGAQEYYGVVPDLACVGKTFSGGFPLSAVTGRADIMEALDPQQGYGGGDSARRVFMTGTFNGNPVVCAAGLAVLRELRKPGTYERLNSYGARLRSRMKEAFDDAGVVAQVHGDGAVTGFTFTDKEVVDFRSEATGNGKLKEEVTFGLLNRSIFAPYKLYSSLSHTEEDLDVTITAFEEALKSLPPR